MEKNEFDEDISIGSLDISNIPIEEPSPVIERMMWKDHPTYSQFFKQVRVGVPIDSVKGKMKILGYDPGVLEYLFSLLKLLGSNDPNSFVPDSF